MRCGCFFGIFFNGGGKIEQDLGKIEKIWFEFICLTCNPLNKEFDQKNDWSADCTLWSCLPSWLPETSFTLKRWV